MVTYHPHCGDQVPAPAAEFGVPAPFDPAIPVVSGSAPMWWHRRVEESMRVVTKKGRTKVHGCGTCLVVRACGAREHTPNQPIVEFPASFSHRIDKASRIPLVIDVRCFTPPFIVPDRGPASSRSPRPASTISCTRYTLSI